MTAPFWKMDPAAWEMVAASLPKPWPRELAEMDLRHWANEARRPNRPVPGARVLSSRWGWTHWQARQLLAKVNPDDRAAMTEKTPRRTVAARTPHGRRTVDNGPTPAIEEIPHGGRTDPARSPPSRDPLLEEGQEAQEILSAEPTLPPAPPPIEAEPRTEPAPPPKLEGLPPVGKGCKPQWLTADVLEVYRAWHCHHPEARAIRADQVKAIRGALGQGYTAAQLVAAVRYVHEAPEELPKVRALREGGYVDLVNTLNGNTRHQNVELGEAWLAGGMSGGKPPATADTTPRPGPTELELRRWYDLEGGRSVVERIEALGHPKAVAAWREWMHDDWRRTDDWWRLEKWLRADRDRRATA